MSWQRELAREMVNDDYAADAVHVSSGDAEPPAEGRVAVNPIRGGRVVIRVSGTQTGGKLLVFDLYLPPGAHVPARHVHPVQEEQFTVLAGQMRFRVGLLGRRSILAHPGETVRVQAGTAHWFGHPRARTSHARGGVRAALRPEG